jgi:hypothetical protein
MVMDTAATATVTIILTLSLTTLNYPSPSLTPHPTSILNIGLEQRRDI